MLLIFEEAGGGKKPGMLLTKFHCPPWKRYGQINFLETDNQPKRLLFTLSSLGNIEAHHVSASS